VLYLETVQTESDKIDEAIIVWLLVCPCSDIMKKTPDGCEYRFLYQLIDNQESRIIDRYRFIERFFDIDFYRLNTSGLTHQTAQNNVKTKPS